MCSTMAVRVRIPVGLGASTTTATRVSHSCQCLDPPAAAARAAQLHVDFDSFYVGEAKRLARRGRVIEMMGLVEERVEEEGVDAGAFLDVVGMHVVRGGCVSALECGRFPYVLEFCRKLNDMGIPPRAYLGRQGLELVVGECRRLLEEKRLEDCIRTLETLASKCGFVVKNLLNPTSCIVMCAKMHNVAMALRYASLLPDLLQSYNVIMQKFRDQGDLHSVLKVFGALRLAGANPDTYTYCILIDACGRCGEAAKATIVFEGLLKAGIVLNVYVYNSIMNVHANNIQHVLQLFKQMRSAGVAADLITYNIVLKSCSLCKNPGVALSLYKELEEKRASGKIEMNVFTYSTLIQIFGEAKILELAFKVKNEMVLAGVTPNVVTWTSLIGACSKAGLVDKALQVFQNMIECGCSPNAHTYNLLLGACVEGGQNERAHKIFNEWKETGRIMPREAGSANPDSTFTIRPDIVAYNTMLKACENFPERVEALMEEMATLGHRPDKRSWSILINAHGSKADEQGAVEAFRRMEKAGVAPDVIAFTAIIKACVNAGDITKAMSFYEAMKCAGISPNHVTYNTLLRAGRSGELQEVQRALSIYEEMREAGCPPNERMLKSLIEKWAEGIIKGNLNGVYDDKQLGNQIFEEYGESLLRKVSVKKESPESFTIDLQGLSKVEARAALLAVLRIIKERHSRLPVEEDLIVITGPSRRNETSNLPVIEDVVTEVLKSQLGLPVFNLGTNAGLHSDNGADAVTVRKPITLGRLKVSKQALNEWILRRTQQQSTPARHP